MPRPARSKIEPTIERHGRVLLLAYDQGIEHGPADFSDNSVDPGYVLDIAEQGLFTGIVMHKGIAAAYYQPGKYTVPLVVKLNGQTDLAPGKDPYAPMVCTVDEAAELGAKAVGYSLYLGSAHEAQMMSEFSGVVRDAHDRRIPVVVWIKITVTKADALHRDMLAYAGRVALELGADYAQLAFAGNVADYAWVVESAGRCKIIAPGGAYKEIHDTAKLAKSVLQAGGVGLVVGRRVWQDSDPLAVAKALHSVLWRDGGRPYAAI